MIKNCQTQSSLIRVENHAEEIKKNMMEMKYQIDVNLHMARAE